MLSKLSLSLTPSPTVTLDSRVKIMQSEGIPVINLGVGEPDFDTPKHIQKEAIVKMREGFTHYSQVAGITELRKVISDKFMKDNNISYELSEVMVGMGSKPLLYLAYLSLLDKNDEVLIPIPAWNTFAEQVKICGGKSVFIALKPPFKLTAVDVEKKITKRTKILLLNSPSNPTGAMIDHPELENIAKLAIKYGFYIISDEIYEKLVYSSKHISIASLSKKIKQQTITVTGMSKAYAMTGWRIGYAGGPVNVINAMVGLQSQIASSAVTFIQHGAIEALGGNQKPLISMHEEFIARRKYIITSLKSLSGITIIEPEGAFYVFASIERLLGKKYKTSAVWCEALLEQQRIAVVPGEAFFYPGYFRLSFAASLQNLKKAVLGIERFIKENYD